MKSGWHICLAACLIGWLSTASAETWRFALIGDTPYTAQERKALPGMLDAIGELQVELIAHIGDFKSGRDRCDDALFLDRYNVFNSSRRPFIFVPGDNEWTDCDRLSNGHYDPQERLNRLRGIFWQSPESLGQTRLPLERQGADYPEHSRFRLGPVLFVTLNLPGSNNNWGLTDQPKAEWQKRNPKVLAWLRESFSLAKAEKRAGIVILFQGNPAFRHFSQGLPHRAYGDFLTALREETLNFSGQVVVVHGDTHWQRVDHPLRDAEGRIIPHFTRVETHGYPYMGWTLGIIDPDTPGLFRFQATTWPENN